MNDNVIPIRGAAMPDLSAFDGALCVAIVPAEGEPILMEAPGLTVEQERYMRNALRALATRSAINASETDRKGGSPPEAA